MSENGAGSAKWALDADWALTSAELDALRAGYLPDVMTRVTRLAVASVYPPGAPYVDAIVDSLYGEEPVAPRDRERCVIALLAAQGETLTLALHIYWGLMEGLSPADVGHTVLLAGAYAGVPRYAAGLLVLEKTCTELRKLLSGPSSPAVLGHFKQVFGAG